MIPQANQMLNFIAIYIGACGISSIEENKPTSLISFFTDPSRGSKMTLREEEDIDKGAFSIEINRKNQGFESIWSYRKPLGASENSNSSGSFCRTPSTSGRALNSIPNQSYPDKRLYCQGLNKLSKVSDILVSTNFADQALRKLNHVN